MGEDYFDKLDKKSLAILFSLNPEKKRIEDSQYRQVAGRIIDVLFDDPAGTSSQEKAVLGRKMVTEYTVQLEEGCARLKLARESGHKLPA